MAEFEHNLQTAIGSLVFQVVQLNTKLSEKDERIGQLEAELAALKANG